MRLDDPVKAFAIDPGVIALPDEPRVEPTLVAGPYLVEFDEVSPLDPDRGIYEPEEIEEFPEQPQRPKSLGFAGSFGVHVLPLVVLLCLASSVPATTGGAIPVQLVLQQAAAEPPVVAEAETPPAQPSEPPPPPPPTPAPPPPPPPIPAAQPKPVIPPPKVVQQAAFTPPPPPRPTVPVPAATPTAQTVASMMSRVAPIQAPIQAAVQTSQTPPPLQRASAPVGLSATGPYLSYLLTLTRQHLDLLPASIVAGRRGRTVIGVRVLDDGTIAKTRVAASSSYPDIDERVEQMVLAVGRFPPLPEALRGQSIELDLNLNFPEVFQR